MDSGVVACSAVFVDHTLELKTEKERDLFGVFHLMRVGDVETKTWLHVVRFLFVCGSIWNKNKIHIRTKNLSISSIMTFSLVFTGTSAFDKPTTNKEQLRAIVNVLFKMKTYNNAGNNLLSI